MRLVLVVMAGVLVLLCIGGAGIAFVLYDDATKIERTAPDAAVDNYLRAYLVNRDDSKAALYRCSAPGDFSQLEAYQADIERREKRFSITIRVTWSTLLVLHEGGQTTAVDTNLRRSIADGSEAVSDRWRFRVVDEDGWRVCGASKVA